MNEADTRAELIEPQLRAAGWGVVEGSRIQRVENAKDKIYASLTEPQKEFIAFVLNNYIKDGVGELDDKKLGQLITLKYQSNTDAERILGDLAVMREVFIDFQKHLTLEQVA